MKSTLRRASLVVKVFGATFRVMAVWAVLGGGSQPAYATHFRYGHINWAPLTGNTIQFTIQNSFRRSFLPSVAYECRDPATLDEAVSKPQKCREKCDFHGCKRAVADEIHGALRWRACHASPIAPMSPMPNGIGSSG